MSGLYIGLMSGTSMDGIDVAIVDFSKVMPKLVDFHTFAYPAHLAKLLHSLCQPHENEVVNLGYADRAAGQAFAQAVNLMLERNHLGTGQITAIGSHGQTVRHHPCGKHGFSLQIGDPHTLAALTGIDVIADFRRKDIALGGQGAPLAPAFHKAMFADHLGSRVILNIGGISNVTYLPSDPNKPVLGFDTGPGNTLLDAWCHLHTGQAYDEGGAWAAQGSYDQALLDAMMAHPFIAHPPPKSTGREDFNLTWLKNLLEQLDATLDPHRVQATLVLFTCLSIARQINAFKDVGDVYVCGGGAQNDFLMECLENELFDTRLHTTEELGVAPDAVEAVAFAWLAHAHLLREPGNLPSVTGASRAAVLGAHFPA